MNDGAWQDRQRSGSLRALKQRQFAVGAIACRATVGGDPDRERDGRAERFGRDIRFFHAAPNAWVQGELLPVVGGPLGGLAVFLPRFTILPVGSLDQGWAVR